MSERVRVVATGLGAVSPIGLGVQAFISGLRTGRSGVVGIGPFDRCRSAAAARCSDFRPAAALDDADAARLPRLVPMALCAAREAMTHAGLLPPGAEAIDHAATALSRRVGLILGTGAGGIDFTLDQARAGLAGSRPSLWTITNATHGNLAGELSIRLGLRGPSLCVSTGCASSSDAVGLAMDMLRGDRAGSPDAMLVVGADAHVRWETLLGMELLRVISVSPWREDAEDPRLRPAAASRPFDRTRDGFLLGEGAWAVLLEREPFARRREVRAVGEMLGFGATCDAHHRVRPAPDAQECARAITLAMEDAGVVPAAVTLAQCHGTSTVLNDVIETTALKLALGEHARRLRASSIKSMIGHPQGACGLASLVGTLGALCAIDDPAAGPFMPPTINLQEPDPACDLDYTPNVAAPLSRDACHTALINCLAFGAKNSALICRAMSR